MLPVESRHGEQGFTLIELLIAMMVSGLILSALATGFIVAMRGTASAHNRFVASNAAQTLATYFTSDVESADPAWSSQPISTDPSAGTGCATSSADTGTTNVLRLQWTEWTTLTKKSAFSASYRMEQSGTEWRLTRYYCTDFQDPVTGDGSPSSILSLKAPTSHVVAYDLSDPTKLVTFTDAGVTSGSAVITSASAKFTSADVDQSISGLGIPANTKIVGFDTQFPNKVTVSANATTPTGTSITVGRYKPVASVVGPNITLKAFAALGSGESIPYFYNLSASMRTPASESFLVSDPGPQTAGQQFSVTVTAFKNGATDIGYTGTVHFTSTDSQTGLPANYAFLAGDMGVHTFPVTVTTAPSTALTVADTVKLSRAGTRTVTVSPAGLDHFSVTAPPSATAGVPFDVTVTAKDLYNNTVASYTGTVHFFTSTDLDPTVVMPADSTLVAGTGTKTFTNGVTLRTAGSQTVSVTDTFQPTKTGTTATISVNQPGVASFAVTAPAATTAWSPFSVTVTAKAGPTGSGATVAGYTGTVNFTSTDLQAVLPVNYTFVAGDNGVHTFSVTLKTTPSQTVTVKDTATSVAGTATVIVNPGASSFLVAAPAATTAGVPFSVTVTAKAGPTGSGDTVVGYTGTVNFTSSDPQAGLPANYTFTTGTGNDNGVHTFSVTLKKATSRTVTITDIAQPLVTGNATVTVNPAAAVPSGLSYNDKSNSAADQVIGTTSPNVTVKITQTQGDQVGSTYTGISDGSGSFTVNVEAFVGSNSVQQTFTYSVVAVDAFGNETAAVTVTATDKK